MKNKDNCVFREKTHQKLSPKLYLTTSTSRPEAPENELLGLLNKLEHREGVLMAIAHHQGASGCYESAEAYKKQAMESKRRAESIRKLPMDQPS